MAPFSVSIRSETASRIAATDSMGEGGRCASGRGRKESALSNILTSLRPWDRLKGLAVWKGSRYDVGSGSLGQGRGCAGLQPWRAQVGARQGRGADLGRGPPHAFRVDRAVWRLVLRISLDREKNVVLQFSTRALQYESVEESPGKIDERVTHWAAARSSSRATMTRMISLVPSRMQCTLRSLMTLSIGYSFK